MSLSIRRASPADHPAFARLFPELRVDDPIPSPEVWADVLCPFTWVAVSGDDVVGYCYTQEYEDTGYVRNVVVGPSARRQGVGRALMERTVEHLRGSGKTRWRLNVMPDNAPALALYARMGLTVLYRTSALRLTWAAASALPVGREPVRPLEVARDALLEDTFDLPRGQLPAARTGARHLLEARHGDGDPRRVVGLAVFDPDFPGAFPFRARSLPIAGALLQAIRPLALPGHAHLNLVIEDDEPLAQALLASGAELRHHILHLHGRIV